MSNVLWSQWHLLQKIVFIECLYFFNHVREPIVKNESKIFTRYFALFSPNESKVSIFSLLYILMFKVV